MTALAPSRRVLALAAGVIINMAFGSLYAWSVFIPGLENELSIHRADVSIVFSLAIVSFTTGNFIAPFAFGRVPTAFLPFIAAAISGGGLALAALGASYPTIIIGYGAAFGFGCGFSYNAILQAALRALPGRPGLANGIIISSFAFGSIIAVKLLADSVDAVGALATLWLLALVVLGVGTVAGILMALSDVRLPKGGWGHGKPENGRFLSIAWIGFFLGALSGIMAIGHAATIVSHFGGTAAAAVLGVTLLGLGNALGRLSAAWLTDHVSARSVAGIAHLTGVLGFIAVLASPTGEGAVLTVGLAGVAYGMTAGVYPAAVSIFLGHESYGRNFAILLTAWGAAGLIGPSLGGYLYDITGDYRVALELACVASVLALINAMRLPRGGAA